MKKSVIKKPMRISTAVRAGMSGSGSGSVGGVSGASGAGGAR